MRSASEAVWCIEYSRNSVPDCFNSPIGILVYDHVWLSSRYDPSTILCLVAEKFEKRREKLGQTFAFSALIF